MRIIFLLSILLFVFASCNEDENTDTNLPIVKEQSTYEVLVQEDIVYAQGLSHENFTSPNAEEVDLKLDIYLPDSDLKNRPLIFFTHGGGFSGGSKQQEQIVDIANFYASRGWVFVSNDYRLKGDAGTVPQEWIDYAQTVPEEDRDQFLAIYPAIRDSKAALRWVVANADSYNINTDYITVGGGSAGAITAITIGVSELEDYRDELEIVKDPSLPSTNLDEEYEIKTIIDFWGSKVALDALEEIYGYQRFDENDPPIIIVHGTADPTVSFSNAEDLRSLYETNNIPFAFYPAENAGHGIWGKTFENKTLAELSFEFIIEQQNIMVE